MLLVSTSHSLLQVDPASGRVHPVHRGLGLYFGIASDGDRYYVAARRRLVSSELSQHDESGRILVFDRSMYLQDIVAAPFPLRDMHEILWHEGSLWITCSFDDMVAIWTPAVDRWDVWHPLGSDPDDPFDKNHLNSLAMIDGAMCVIAHNRGPSELLRYDIPTRTLLSREPFGNQAHNIRTLRDGALMTASSGEGTLISTNGWKLDVGGFTRGILLGERENYVGVSEIAERSERDFTTGRIVVYDKDWKHLREISLPGEGLLLDIQPFEP
jgi:hypothetical protein